LNFKYSRNHYNNIANVLTIKIGLKQTKSGYIVHINCIFCVFSLITRL